MVTRTYTRLVPKFSSLQDFLLAKKWYERALFMPGPERSDSGLRIRRHQPGFSFSQVPHNFKQDPHKTHIRPHIREY